MSEVQSDSSHLGVSRFADIPGYASLAELALDLHWSWNHGADDLWRLLGPELWRRTQNPWIVLRSASRDHIQQLLATPALRDTVEGLLRTRREEAVAPAWFQTHHPNSPLTAIAYFSMEFMLSGALPIYSGGLGNVAGDQLRTASDLGVPVLGISLLYQQGYFRQVIDRDGAQQAVYPYNDPGQMPVTPLSQPNGEWLRLEIALPGYSLWVRAWQVQVGRVKLYLLDSNDVENDPVNRGITSQLYGGGPELRLKQEMLLGIGGRRLLDALGIKAEVCHLNEGHAAFAVLERAHRFMVENKVPFDAALAATRAGNVFTTHTAVEAGFDRFAPELIERYLGRYAEQALRIPMDELLALGRLNPADRSEPFNMAYLATRGSGSVNGVSALHGKVSRSLFGSLYPRWPVAEVPIGFVTNGVHMPTWDSAAADALWTKAAGKDRWLGTMDTVETDIRSVSDSALWELRADSRRVLMAHIRERLSLQMAASGASAAAVEAAKSIFDPNALTLGFARRFATYKRPNLLLQDRERLLRLLSNTDRPVQLVIAGKAHPEDGPGRALVQEWIEFIRQQRACAHIVFLSDYDMLMSEQLVQGVDVWINTPRRPWEACGTSGMKVLVNGGLNLSELDGWWAEAYTPEVGWALGDGQDHGDDPAWDAAEAIALYDLLERAVIPEFYSRGETGIPTAWVARIRESMARLTARFSANRAVRQYVEEHYLPAAAAYAARAAEGGKVGLQMAALAQALDRGWAALRFGDVSVRTAENTHTFSVSLCLGELDPAALSVEVYADALGGSLPERVRMRAAGAAADDGWVAFTGATPAIRPATDYTVRAIPYCEGAHVPLEFQHILWQR